MKRGTIILILFVLIAVGIVGASLFLQNQPPIEITVAVDPLAEDWLRQMVDDFNASDTLINNTRRVQVNLQVISDLEVWSSASRSQTWTAQQHPDAWIPSASISVDYTSSPFTVVQPSLVQTPLVISAYSSRAAVLTDGAPLRWDDIFQAAETQSWSALGGQANWQFVNIAFTLADSEMCGLATLYSAAAAVNDTPTLNSGAIRGSFYDVFEPVIESVPNFNSIGSDVAAFVARGTASADIGIAPENVWLKGLSGLVNNEPVVFSYPEYTFMFDFPLAMWDDANTTSDTRAAVTAFGNWLLEPAQQATAVTYGLRPVQGSVPQTARLFADAQQYGIVFDLPDNPLIQPPSSATDTQGLISWFTRTRNR